jgi:hypothetical protein
LISSGKTKILAIKRLIEKYLKGGACTFYGVSGFGEQLLIVVFPVQSHLTIKHFISNLTPTTLQLPSADHTQSHILIPGTVHRVFYRRKEKSFIRTRVPDPYIFWASRIRIICTDPEILPSISNVIFED